MRKMFCDGCGNEMEVNGNVLSGENKADTISVELRFGHYDHHDGIWTGDFCLSCAFDAIAEFDNRPKRMMVVAMPKWEDLPPRQMQHLQSMSYQVNGRADTMYRHCRAAAMAKPGDIADGLEPQEPSDSARES